MLRAAATVVALLAALPAVTPLLGGYKSFSECRNLTHLGPGKWPGFSAKPYYFTGLLVMSGDTCSGFLASAKFMVSSSLCRLWKANVSFSNDIEDEDSEVRIGIIQGDVSKHHYQRQLVKQYLHWGKSNEEALKNPIMLVEVLDSFDGWNDEHLPGIMYNTPLSDRSTKSMLGEIVGYEHSVNMPIYHQAAFDAHIYYYHVSCRKYGRTEWNLSENAICTWDVSPVRTVCNIDRGAPVVVRRHVLGIVLGIVDDKKTPSNFCGEGRIHYNVFLLLRNYARWIKEETDRKAKIVNLADGRIIEECDENVKPGGAPPEKNPEPPKRPGRHHHKKPRSGSTQHTASVGPLLLAAVATVARLASQY